MKFIGFIFLFLFISLKAYASETFGVILSGGVSKENNHFSFYNSTKEMYSAFRTAGIKRTNITTMYDDGGGGVNTRQAADNSWAYNSTDQTKTISVPTSLEGDDRSDMKNPATSSGLSATFDDLAKKAKAGDHLIFFITGHGNKIKGIALWEKRFYSVEDLEKQLNKLPEGVTTHIITNICYGGQLTRLTNNNVCVIANADKDNVNYSLPNSSPFVTAFTDELKNRNPKQNSKPSLIGALFTAKAKDLYSNKYPQTSIDYFIDGQKLQLSKSPSESFCKEAMGPLFSLEQEIAEASKNLSQVTDPRKSYYEKYLKEHLKKTITELNLYKDEYAERLRNKRRLALDKLKKEWSTFSEKEKTQLRPQYTGLVENLRHEDEVQNEKINNLTTEQKRALSEMRFLKYASSSQLEQYYAIRRCLEYEI